MVADAWSKVRTEAAEHVGVIDNAHAFLLLELANLLMESFHPRQVHLRAELMLGVVSVVENSQL